MSTNSVKSLISFSIATGIKQFLTMQPTNSSSAVQFPIPLTYNDTIASLEEGSDLSIFLSLVAPNPYVVIGEDGIYPSTRLIGAGNEGRWGGNHGEGENA